MQSQHVTPWYKQFWPWFLIVIPLSSIIVSMFVVRFATNTDDSLVVDDYYKEGKAINAKLDKVERARYLNITTEMTVNAEGSVALTFHSGIPKTGEALKLSFYHATLEDRDMEILLTRDASGVYRGSIEGDVNAKWQITLTPLNDEWKIQRSIFLPQSKPFKFNP